MFNLEKFIADSVTSRPVSMFAADIEENKETLIAEIRGKKVCVIGGAGSIGSSFIKAVLHFEPASVVVVDLNENGLAELVRDVRSTEGLYVPDEFRCYTLNFADPIFERIFREEKGFDIVANFSAHKHVRSEKDKYSVQALIENNDIKAKKLMDFLCVYPPKHFFCVSTDKAANPVNIMGASKRIMEDLVMAYNTHFKVTTARFANVAFSNGSLPDGWIHRLQKKQPLAAPSDVKRYFVSPEESGQICMLACILGNGGEVFFPKLGEDQMLTFSSICDDFVKAEGFKKIECQNDPEAKQYATQMSYESDTYPVVYFKSDTTGEKAYEEFYIPGEKINMERFSALGVVEETTRRPMPEINSFFAELEDIFQKEDFTKAEVVESIKKFIPNFEHEEKGKNLDQKM
ncbi:NAD-dependent epimerase/dehydratase family protein [Bacteroides nordii]|uniref:NAD-dependent epimerase/dehydratase family protein n=1 Tax=Bacteroides nordii TaxID=291645 RepID=A0A413V766_9BACE|nr:UDP-N-acetylglucosamine 4,6-dehydratase [Bacteroides nordii]RHB29410.1 NAD-dependent epimerase/dehydratase family protein [Bacteroides nordii]